jgi:hypothetical protein
MNLVHHIKLEKIKSLNINDINVINVNTIVNYKIKVPELYNIIYSEKNNIDLLNQCMKKIFIILKNNNIITQLDL